MSSSSPMPNTYRGRVLERTDDGGCLKLICADEAEPTVYESSAVGSTPSVPGSGVTVIGSTVLEVLQIPLLDEADDIPGIYIAAGSYQASWPGAVIYRSTNDGASFAEVGVVTERATLGRLDRPPHIWEGGNTLDPGGLVVRLAGFGSLSTATWAELLDGANEAVIGDEVIQFMRADLLEAGVYRLSGLLRGRRGTVPALHRYGARFVLLDAAVKRYDSPLSLLGRPTVYRGVSLGHASASGFDVRVTEQQQHLVPLAALDLHVAYAGATGYVATWRRRTRYAAPWTNAEPPVGETSERYRVRVWFDATADFVNSIVTEPTLTFGAGLDLSNYFVEVSQLSALIGDGATASTQIGA